MPVKRTNAALDYLTTGYAPVAQMSLWLAHHLGYFDTAQYALVNPVGDPSSAGLPYFMEAIESDGEYLFLAYDGRSIISVEADFNILVYRRPPPALPDEAPDWHAERKRVQTIARRLARHIDQLEKLL